MTDKFYKALEEQVRQKCPKCLEMGVIVECFMCEEKQCTLCYGLCFSGPRYPKEWCQVCEDYDQQVIGRRCEALLKLSEMGKELKKVYESHSELDREIEELLEERLKQEERKTLELEKENSEKLEKKQEEKKTKKFYFF